MVMLFTLTGLLAMNFRPLATGEVLSKTVISSFAVLVVNAVELILLSSAD